MATFPKIAGPCPYKGPLSDILDQDSVCGLCHRQVHDLSAMTERQRVAFLKRCSGTETCVSYRLPVAALALAFTAALPAAAQEVAAADPTAAEGALDEATVVGNLPLIVSSYRYVPVAEASQLYWDERHGRAGRRRFFEPSGQEPQAQESQAQPAVEDKAAADSPLAPPQP